MAHVDLTGGAAVLSTGKIVEVEHNIAESRLRMLKGVRLRPEAGDSRGALSTKEQRLFWTLAGWLAR